MFNNKNNISALSFFNEEIDLLQVPIDSYTEALHVLFMHPDFKSIVSHRNKLVKAENGMRNVSSARANIAKRIQTEDRKLADIILNVLIQSSLTSDVTLEHYSLNTLFRYFVDHNNPVVVERVRGLCYNLDRLTFMADMLESVLIDIKADMKFIFDSDFEFKQFDAVSQVLQQLKGFFGAVRGDNPESKEGELFNDYSDSINKYIYKRLKTYNEKKNKLNPLPAIMDAETLVKAINQFFGTTDKFGKRHIKTTKSGRPYVNIMQLVSDADKIEIEKIDKYVGGVDKSKNMIEKYAFNVTDAIIDKYKPDHHA